MRRDRIRLVMYFSCVAFLETIERTYVVTICGTEAARHVSSSRREGEEERERGRERERCGKTRILRRERCTASPYNLFFSKLAQGLHQSEVARL